jgi:pimeloyl-ACP methyl ester carboxylesterase
MTRWWRWLTVLVGVSVLAVGCSGGGGSDSAEDDPLEDVGGSGERQVNFKGADGLKLAGTLTIPDNARGAVPGVVIVSSLAPNIDRDGIQTPTQPDTLYKELSATLVSSGVATLRFDPRGVGASKIESGGKKPTFDDAVGDAAAAAKFLSQRKEIGSAPLGVVGHDLGGLIAMRVAASENRVKGVTLISTPGRPVVDVWAETMTTTYGAPVGDRFRAIAADLTATGTLPKAEEIPSQIQSVLGLGQEQLLKTLFAVDPVADARQVKVPTLVVVGAKSPSVRQVDADRLLEAIGPKATLEVSPEGPTLREFKPDPPPIAFDPNNEATHVFGARPLTQIPRHQPSLDRIAGYLNTNLKPAA